MQSRLDIGDSGSVIPESTWPRLPSRGLLSIARSLTFLLCRGRNREGFSEGGGTLRFGILSQTREMSHESILKYLSEK
jgi:hypothetical protein